MLQILAIGTPTGALMMICQRFLSATRANFRTLLGALLLLAAGLTAARLAATDTDLVWAWIAASWAGTAYVLFAAALSVNLPRIVSTESRCPVPPSSRSNPVSN
jgi:hypothetical protein